MRKLSVFLLIGIIASVAGASAACAAPADRSGWYVGVGTGGGRTDFVDFNGDPRRESVGVFRVHGGYRVNPYIALEGRVIGAGNNSDHRIDDVSFGGVSVNALGILPLSDVVDAFGGAGYYRGSSDLGYFHSHHENGLVYGGGFGFHFGGRRQFTVRAEYENYDTDRLDRFWGITGSFQYNFAGRR